MAVVNRGSLSWTLLFTYQLNMYPICATKTLARGSIISFVDPVGVHRSLEEGMVPGWEQVDGMLRLLRFRLAAYQSRIS